jgi:DNA repair protein REV1
MCTCVLSFFLTVSRDANFALIGVPYQLEQLSNNQQPKLSKFFSLRNSKNSQDTFTNALCQVEPGIDDSSASVGKSEDGHSSEVEKVVEPSRQISMEADDTVSENTDAIMTDEQLTSVGVKCDEEDPAGGRNDASKDESNFQSELETNYQKPSTSISSPCSDDQNVKEFPSPASIGPSKQGHSTLSDPNFVENYFKVVKLMQVWIFILLVKMANFLLVLFIFF